MIKWYSSYYLKGLKKQKFTATMMDVKLCEACINNIDDFQEYLKFLEDGIYFNKVFPSRITKRILDGVKNLNWDGYFDKMYIS